MITATPDGRRLRIRVTDDGDTAADSGVDDILVSPLSAKRGVYLSRVYVAQALGTIPGLGVDPPIGEALESILIECVGPENYERLAGMIVVAEDRDSDLFARGIRYRAYEEHDGRVASDGEPLRHVEIQQIMQAAFFWQSVVGIKGVNAYLEDPEPDVAAGKALGLLLTALGIRLSQTSPSGESENQTQQAGTPATTTPTGTSSSAVRLPARSPAGPAIRTPMDHQPPGNHPPRSSGRG